MLVVACQFPDYAAPRAGAGGGASAAGASSVGMGAAEPGGSSGSSAGTTTTTGGTGSGSGEGGGAGAAVAGTGGGTTGGAQSMGGLDAAGAAGSAAGGAGTSGDFALFDDFEAGAGQWLEVAGNPWAVVLDADRASHGYQLAPTFADFYVAVAKEGVWTDQVIEARVKVLAFGGTSTSDVVSVLGRFANIDNYYAAVLRPDGRVALRARVAGAPLSTLKTSATLGLAAGTWYDLRFELIGDALRLYVDDQLAAQITDNRLAQGTVALGGDNTSAIFDDVSVVVP